MSPRPRRVLYVEINEDGTVGGSHLSLFNLARCVDRSRYCPVVLFYQENRYVEDLRRAGVEVHTWEAIRRRERGLHGRRPLLWKALLLVGAILRRVRFLRKHGIDLVHLNNAVAASFDDWLPAARMAGVPCITHARGEEQVPARRIARWLTRRFDLVIAVSDYIADSARRLGIDSERVRRVYDGIDAEEFRGRVRRPAAEVRSELGVAPETLLVVMVGHLRGWKGQDVVLAALAQVDPALLRQLRIALVGGTPFSDTEYAAALHATVVREGLEDRVMFLGARSDVPDLMNAADVVLHASTRPEPYGLVILEAMALGKTIVATNIGGPAEILTPGSGLLFDPREPADLARILERLVADVGLRCALGDASQTRLREFPMNRMVTEIEALYGELLR